ncbi:MarR family transcriptional regulator [Streptomyces griseochromogenes]|uniref:MarR family transcriptional regulator n=1 Tax=Streptomyces griseochromogenes TaxID=68214 RepID=A0A1B1BDK0_9ACTN|nr:MarR family transcriptional regulator [Streptomyces griseochromogenes]ANP56812.1 MarR family transcriptional regulator [Streptomyces griseochromogenes]
MYLGYVTICVKSRIEIERALTRVTYLGTRARQHDRLMALAGVPLDRAAVALLRQVADCEPLRPGELTQRLGVEASHATRTVQQLQRAGYVTRGMRLALADWQPEELRQLAALFHRMVDDFLAHAVEDEWEQGADAPAAKG